MPWGGKGEVVMFRDMEQRGLSSQLHSDEVLDLVSAWDQQMLSGNKKKEEIQEKFKLKFKSHGVSFVYFLNMLIYKPIIINQ